MRAAGYPLCAAVLATLAGTARAEPGYYVHAPYDLAGVTTLELRHWTTKARGRGERVWPELAIGHGLNSRWHTQLLASFVGPSNLRTRLDLWRWQNIVQLTQGEWPVDVALLGALVRPAERADGHLLEAGPLLQGDLGRTRWNLNLLFERRLGAEEHRPTELKVQWQLRHRWQPALHVGLSGFSELGDWNHWLPRDRQSHRAGPAVFGTLPLAGGTTLQLDAAVLRGATFGQHGRMVTLRVAASF